MKINGEQAVKLEKGIIEFKNYFKQIPGLFKVYAAFECFLDSVESYESSCTKKYQDHILAFLLTNLFVDDRFSKPIALYRGKNAAYKFIKAILKEREYCKK